MIIYFIKYAIIGHDTSKTKSVVFESKKIINNIQEFQKAVENSNSSIDYFKVNIIDIKVLHEVPDAPEETQRKEI